MTDNNERVRATGAQLDFRNDMSYGDYLQLDQVLSAQRPLSPDPNELLFIVQHQTSELWMKLMLHELTRAIEGVRTGDLQPAFKQLSRVSRIMEQLVHAWDVLATMTPLITGTPVRRATDCRARETLLPTISWWFVSPAIRTPRPITQSSLPPAARGP